MTKLYLKMHININVKMPKIQPSVQFIAVILDTKNIFLILGAHLLFLAINTVLEVLRK